MKIAFVYDRVNKWGGAERILLALHEIWPDAPLFTSVYNPQKAQWAKVFPKIYYSFLQKFPFASNHHEFYPFLMPLAFESFDFDQFDVVISLTSEAAKGILTKPKTLHICYCLTPTRYLWSGASHYRRSAYFGLATPFLKFLYPFITTKLRLWDQIASNRPDYFISISQNVASRVKKYYQKDSTIIYPPVDTNLFKGAKYSNKADYFLIVSRLVSYKGINLAIEAFNTLGWPLIIIGSGREKKDLQNIAKSNITFITPHLTDSDLLTYYQNCRALIFPGSEDLGLTPIEAQAVGKPVIALRSGGTLETIKEGISGEFFDHPNIESLIQTLRLFDKKDYNSINIRKGVLKFDKEIFKKAFKNIVYTQLAKLD